MRLTKLGRIPGLAFHVRKVDLDVNPAALAQALDKPARRRVKASFVEKRWMQKIRHGAGAGNGMIDELACFLEEAPSKRQWARRPQPVMSK